MFSDRRVIVAFLAGMLFAGIVAFLIGGDREDPAPIRSTPAAQPAVAARKPATESEPPAPAAPVAVAAQPASEPAAEAAAPLAPTESASAPTVLPTLVEGAIRGTVVDWMPPESGGRGGRRNRGQRNEEGRTPGARRERRGGGGGDGKGGGGGRRGGGGGGGRNRTPGEGRRDGIKPGEMLLDLGTEKIRVSVGRSRHLDAITVKPGDVVTVTGQRHTGGRGDTIRAETIEIGGVVHNVGPGSGRMRRTPGAPVVQQ